MNPAASAVGAALLFGASTPAAKLFAGDVHPILLAGLLYLGSGVGLALWLLFRGRWRPALNRADAPWLAGAIAAGGVAGPVLLMTGLARTEAANASLLLNLEGVLTALIAWFAFKENFDRRIALGMALIVAGGALLAFEPGALAPRAGSLAIAAACLAWAIDNNLTRRISGADAATIAAIKGLVAGSVNVALAAMLSLSWPGPTRVAGAVAVGFLGYGVSLALFVVALRELGAARTGAYFSVAPFAGVLVAILLLGETPHAHFWLAAVLVAAGIWLHVSERHEHLHVHEPLEHEHRHVHDAHHQHEHEEGTEAGEPHSHPHRHEHMLHAHPHYPDLHHRHRH